MCLAAVFSLPLHLLFRGAMDVSSLPGRLLRAAVVGSRGVLGSAGRGWRLSRSGVLRSGHEAPRKEGVVAARDEGIGHTRLLGFTARKGGI